MRARMNKRLEKEIRQRIAEKRGWKWALKSFGYEVWGETESQISQDLADRGLGKK